MHNERALRLREVKVLPENLTLKNICLYIFFPLTLYYYFFFSIRPSPGLLPVLGPLTRYMTPTLDAALLICGSPGQVRTISSRAGADLGQTLVI